LDQRIVLIILLHRCLWLTLGFELWVYGRWYWDGFVFLVALQILSPSYDS